MHTKPRIIHSLLLILAMSPFAPSVLADDSDSACIQAAQQRYSLDPIVVGPRNLVGTENFAAKQAKGIDKGVLGSLLGGGGSNKSSKPKTKKDPSRKLDYVTLQNEALNSELGVHAKWTDDGLLVSTRIEESPDKGTFQAIFLEDCNGRRLGPSKVEIYKIWADVNLTVNWTRTTYVDGNVVSQESGGWSETWTEDLGIFDRNPDDPEAIVAGIWTQAGYDRAHAGLQQIGAYFNITPEQFSNLGEMGLITHLTRPREDPVITTPFNALLSGMGDEIQVANPNQGGDRNQTNWEKWQNQCPVQAEEPAIPSQQTDATCSKAVVEREPESVQEGETAGTEIVALALAGSETIDCQQNPCEELRLIAE
jgi:hypothetical protein